MDDVVGSSKEVYVRLGLEEDNEGFRKRRPRAGFCFRITILGPVIFGSWEICQEGLRNGLFLEIELERLPEDASSTPDDTSLRCEELILNAALLSLVCYNIPRVRGRGRVRGEQLFVDGMLKPCWLMQPQGLHRRHVLVGAIGRSQRNSGSCRSVTIDPWLLGEDRILSGSKSWAATLELSRVWTRFGLHVEMQWVGWWGARSRRVCGRVGVVVRS